MGRTLIWTMVYCTAMGVEAMGLCPVYKMDGDPEMKMDIGVEHDCIFLRICAAT